MTRRWTRKNHRAPRTIGILLGTYCAFFYAEAFADTVLTLHSKLVERTKLICTMAGNRDPSVCSRINEYQTNRPMIPIGGGDSCDLRARIPGLEGLRYFAVHSFKKAEIGSTKVCHLSITGMPVRVRLKTTEAGDPNLYDEIEYVLKRQLSNIAILTKDQALTNELKEMALGLKIVSDFIFSRGQYIVVRIQGSSGIYESYNEGTCCSGIYGSNEGICCKVAINYTTNHNEIRKRLDEVVEFDSQIVAYVSKMKARIKEIESRF